MDAIKLRGFLIVDLGESTEDEKTLVDMWNASQLFFLIINGPSPPSLPQMDTADGAGSRHAAVGFASNADGAMQLLETRTRRSDGTARKDCRDSRS